MIYNYPPKIFAYPTSVFLCDLNQPEPNGMMRLFVVIVTPHNGYAVVNQTFFQPSYNNFSRGFLDPNRLSYNSASMYRETVFAVPAGSFQTTLEIAFLCGVQLGFNTIQPGHAVEFPMGTVGVRVTFYDVQANRTYVSNATATVWVAYSNITQSSTTQSTTTHSTTTLEAIGRLLFIASCLPRTRQ
jgi:hypothetical protein